MRQVLYVGLNTVGNESHGNYTHTKMISRTKGGLNSEEKKEGRRNG